MRAKIALLGALAGLFVGGLAAAAPVAAAEPLPDIAVTGSFDKATYKVDEAFVLTVKVSNKSSFAAKKIHFLGGDSGGADIKDFGVLQTGFDLAGGETKTFALDGVTTAEGKKLGKAFVAFELGIDAGDAHPDDNYLTVRAAVTGGIGNIKGHIYPGDSISSPAESDQIGVPGVKVEILDPATRAVLGQATTDATGHFALNGLRAGEVELRFVMPAGWQILSGEGQDPVRALILGDDTADLDIVAKKVPVPSASVSPSPAAGSQLPITGSNTGLIVGGGVLAVALGTGLVLVARRRRIVLKA
ncbi:LPXTG cell wall anchor domain-containing protein [Dactylosporangium cerinum]